MIALGFGLLTVSLFWGREELADLIAKVWLWYKKATGYDKAVHDRLWRGYLARMKEEGR
jgi:hypothetical protein